MLIGLFRGSPVPKRRPAGKAALSIRPLVRRIYGNSRETPVRRTYASEAKEGRRTRPRQLKRAEREHGRPNEYYVGKELIGNVSDDLMRLPWRHNATHMK